MEAHLERALRKGKRLSLRSPRKSLGTQHAALGEEKELLDLLSGNSPKAGEPALAEQRAGDKTRVTHSLCGETKPAC